MTWAREQRIAYIKARIDAGQPVNRADVGAKFNCTIQTVSADFKRFGERYPGLMSFDEKLKAYRRADLTTASVGLSWRDRALAAEARVATVPNDALSGVSTTFNAFHFDPIMNEGRHEHTWTVTIWRRSEPWTDGRSALAALETFIDAIAPMQCDETRQLPQELWSNEALARAVLVLGNVVKVNVDRHGLHAEVWA